MAEEARITDGHVRMGVAAGDHAVVCWPLLCGLAKAKYYLLTADFIDGVEADRIGLVSKAVPGDELLAEAQKVADKLATGSQTATRLTKRALNLWMNQAAPAFDASIAFEILGFPRPRCGRRCLRPAREARPAISSRSPQRNLDVGNGCSAAIGDIKKPWEGPMEQAMLNSGRARWRFVLALVVMLALLGALGTTVPSADAQVTPAVVISEIHYHPQAVGSSFPNYDDRENTEFIEIVNLENSAVDLSDWCLDRAVDFCFAAGTSLAAGTTLVIADNAAAFDDLYGFMPAGVYSGKLSNSGEQVRLVDDAGVVVVDLTWQTSDPWPVTPDGNGPSLELASALGDAASPSSWVASSQTNGTPGSVPTLSNAAPPLVLDHSAPELVATGQSVAVTATTVNTAAMTLVYNVNYGSNQTITMTQNAGTWQATLPALGEGGFVQYRFDATGPGGTTTSPRADDVVDWWAVGVASPQQSPGVPVLDLFISPQNWTNIENKTCPCDGAVAYEGRIWTNVAIRRAGFTSINLPKGHLRLDFPDGSPFVGSFLDGPVDELTLDAGFPNYDMVREQFSWQMMEQIGFPPIRNQHVRVHRSGDYHGLFLLREEQDGNWRARHDLDRGAFYKVDAPTDTFGFSGHLQQEGSPR